MSVESDVHFIPGKCIHTCACVLSYFVQSTSRINRKGEKELYIRDQSIIALSGAKRRKY